jgi:hypothetical protein
MPPQSPTAAHSLIDRDPSFFSCPRVALLLSSLLLLSMCSWYIGVSLVLPVKAGTELRLREFSGLDQLGMGQKLFVGFCCHCPATDQG